MSYAEYGVLSPLNVISINSSPSADLSNLTECMNDGLICNSRSLDKWFNVSLPICNPFTSPLSNTPK